MTERVFLYAALAAACGLVLFSVPPAAAGAARSVGVLADASTPQSLMEGVTPVLIDQSDGANVNYELGTRFVADQSGRITAIRFYKSPQEFGTHTGRIWSANGAELASVVFAAETDSGWQTQVLATPLSVAAGAEYTVSVNTANTFYSATNNGLAAEVRTPGLHSVAGNNGRYGAPGIYPTQSWGNSNYFRDVVFVPGATSPPATGTNTLYIRDGASGTTCADWANACPTLPRNLRRGVTYYVAPGRYLPANGDDAFRLDAAASGSSTIVIKKATPNDHGTNVGWQASYGFGQAVFSGTLEINSSNWVIEGQAGGGASYRWQGDFGFRVVSTSSTDAMIRIGWDGRRGTIVPDISNVTVRHIEIVGMGRNSPDGGAYSNDGLAVYGAKNVTLSSYWMHHIGRCPFFLSGHNLVIEQGWVESFYTGPTHAEIASIWGFGGVLGDVTFRNNLFTDVQSTGGIMWSTKDHPSARLRIHGNTFYRRPGTIWPGANGLVGGWTAEMVSNVMLYNNNFINVDQESLSVLPQKFANNYAYNNIFYNSQAPDFKIFAGHDNNLFIRSGDTQGETSGIAFPAGTDPFVDATKFDFRLKTQTQPGKTLTPAYDGKDAFGNVRGLDGNWDRGAFEYR